MIGILKMNQTWGKSAPKVARCFFVWASLSILQNLFSSVPSGVVNVTIKAGSTAAPSYTIISPGIKGNVFFQGTILSTYENNVSFDKLPDLSNPAIEKGPFIPGILGSLHARAEAVLDENGSVDYLTIVDGGSNYLGYPLVHLTPPVEGNGSSMEYSTAYAEAETNASTLKVDSLSIINPGSGYISVPTVTIDGGPYFLRVIEEDSNYSGIYFRILSNSDDSLELNNSTGHSLANIFPAGTEVEVFKGWTLGSLLGFETTQLVSDINASLADWVYAIKQTNQQEGNSSDYIPYFHNGNMWTRVDSPNEDFNNLILSPDQAVIISGRNDQNTSLIISGSASTVPSYWEIPEVGKKQLLCNPHSTSVNLSDLIPNHAITDDNSSVNSHLILAHIDQDKADNIQILKSSIWSTFWHDGTNLNITKPAQISARAGSGIGGALTVNDFSMSSGSIESLTNPLSGNVVVTSTDHGLSNGFKVTISSALGRLTNDEKLQINANGDLVESGEGLVVESSVNGIWEVINCTSDTFELNECTSNSDFLNDSNATWSTGDSGEGYDTNVSLSILGGGGRGAKAYGIVENGKIVSIALQQGGFFYHQTPEITVHPGGWRMIGKGNSPLNDLTVPAGSGVLIIRKHPFGISSQIPLKSFK